MSVTAQEENARMLATAAGISQQDAAQLLKVAVAITYDPNDQNARACGDHIRLILSRTIEVVTVNAESNDAVVLEVVVGGGKPRFGVKRIHVWVAADERIVVSRSRMAEAVGACRVHPITILLGACYACAAALKAMLGEAIPFPSPETFVVDLNDLYPDDISAFYSRINIGTVTLTGAGAIGTAFIYGLSLFDVTGRMDVADDDVITNGNLQRCVLYEATHENDSKAETLCAVAKPLLPQVQFSPHVCRLEQLRDDSDPQWLRRLVVAVDSRRVRRRLQSEIPGEVFDASTTGIAEVVMHFHKEPNEAACLGCLYWDAPEEAAHDQHIARSLGVDVADIQKGCVSTEAAARIARRHSHLAPGKIIGLAYDTVFKDVVCSTGNIDIGEAEEVLTPFAFVSVLAGAYLAVEFIRRTAQPRTDFNEWRFSPWNEPFSHLRKLRLRNPKCEFCSKAELRKAAHQIWSSGPAFAKKTSVILPVVVGCAD